jgi:hypothetical protein
MGFQPMEKQEEHGQDGRATNRGRCATWFFNGRAVPSFLVEMTESVNMYRHLL